MESIEERIKNFEEFHDVAPVEEAKKQADRCMDCGVPFCQAGMMIAGMASGYLRHISAPSRVPKVRSVLVSSMETLAGVPFSRASFTFFCFRSTVSSFTLFKAKSYTCAGLKAALPDCFKMALKSNFASLSVRCSFVFNKSVLPTLSCHGLRHDACM